AAGIAAYYLFSPHQQQRRAVRHMLAELQAAVNSKEPPKLDAFLQRGLAPEAQVSLQVEFSSLSFLPQHAGMEQRFSREEFIRFIGLTFYSLSDYGITGTSLEQLDSAGQAGFDLTGFGEGASYMGGSPIQSRFLGEMHCDAQVMFAAASAPQVREAKCHITLRIVPKDDAQNVQRLKDTLFGRPQQP
ncbi:MAG: hypothetical protein JO089_00945, partial [Alphaproteobacteria bacterium]|nr:hypothetical protein [Alphaproteobacteria bacterium]